MCRQNDHTLMGNVYRFDTILNKIVLRHVISPEFNPRQTIFYGIPSWYAQAGSLLGKDAVDL